MDQKIDLPEIIDIPSDFTWDYDYYDKQRDSFLKQKFGCEDLDILTFDTLELFFSISKSIKNVEILFEVLNTISPSNKTIDNSDVHIKILGENDMLEFMPVFWDLLMIVKNWRSMILKINEKEINATYEFRYCLSYLYKKNNVEQPYLGGDIKDIKKRYKSPKRRKKEELKEIKEISRNDLEGALDAVLKEYVSLYCKHLDVKEYVISNLDKVILVENELIVSFRMTPKSWRREDDKTVKDWEYPVLMIQEITYNSLFVFNFTSFRKRFGFTIAMENLLFHGFDYYRREVDHFPEINKALPELELPKRKKMYPGETYHFVILRMESIDHDYVYGIGYTKNKVHSYVLKICKELETKNSRSLGKWGISCLPDVINSSFFHAFLDWKGEKKLWRLENKFAYYYVDKQVKNEFEINSICKEVLDAAYGGQYDMCEYGGYSKPVNRWKSEELVYDIVKKLYKDYHVLYQYRPAFLSTEGGNMSYDIYICELRVAIEYQGKQHFEPVDYFGGEENFKRQKKRDMLKLKRSKENNIKLVYVNYWESITPKSIREKIEEVIK